MGETPTRRDNKQNLLKELFGDSKWASDKEKGSTGLKDGGSGKTEEKSKTDGASGISDAFSFGNTSTNRQRDRGSVLDGADVSASYVPSNSAPRRPRRQPPKPLDIDDFGFSNILGSKQDEPIKDSSDIIREKEAVSNIDDFKLLSSHQGERQLQRDRVGSKAQDVVVTESSSGIPPHLLSSAVTSEGVNPFPSSHNPSAAVVQPTITSSGQVNYTAPPGMSDSLNAPASGMNPVVQTPFVAQPGGQLMYPQFYPLPPQVAQYPTGDGEMVEELKNAQATFGAALAAHHINIQSYMQLLLDEARRLAAVSNVTCQISKDKCSKVETMTEDALRNPIKDSIQTDSEMAQNENDEYVEKNDKYEETTQTDYEVTQPESLKKSDLEDVRKQYEVELVEQKKQLETTLREQTMLQIQELKMTVQRLEMEKSNVLIKLENMKLHHQVEIEFLKKTNAQEALLWESRIEKIQQFCFTIEKEYAEKLDKMKENEEELVKSQKARIAALQAERLSDLQQLNDLHKAIMQQALSSSTFYSGGRVQRISVRSPEKPANEEELTEREAALIRKERQFEEMKLEWEEERRRGIEGTLEKERAVREAEAAWTSRREAESRQLARREARTEELSKLVEEMREQALTEAKELAADKLKVQTDRARLEALMKAETGIMANPEHILQMRAEVEAGLEESKEMKTALENERRRLADEWNRLEARLLEVEAREREVGRIREDMTRERNDAASQREEYTRRRDEAEKAEARARAREQEALEKSNHLDQQIKQVAKERLEVKRDKMEIETAKTRLDILLPELGPNESFMLTPPRNYVDPKAVIMRLKAERELESYVVNPTPRNPFS